MHVVHRLPAWWPRLGSLVAILAMALLVRVPMASADAGEVTVYRNPACGCCGAWADHLARNGFVVRIVERADLAADKARFGVPPTLASCHTARVDGYTVEGHVPAADIRRLLAERPPVSGLAVPGMPHGSPGMETGRVDRYQVMTFDGDGNHTVFSQH